MTRVNEIVFDDVELETFSNRLLDEFANSVEEDDGVKRFGAVISRLIWLENDNRR